MTDSPSTIQARAHTETMARHYLDLAALELLRAEARSREATSTSVGLTDTGRDPATLAAAYARALQWWTDTAAPDPWSPRAQIVAHAAARMNACPECLGRSIDTSTQRPHKTWCSTPF